MCFDQGQIQPDLLRFNLRMLVKSPDERNQELLNVPLYPISESYFIVDHSICQAKIEEIIKKLFSEMDKDDSGVITASELREVPFISPIPSIFDVTFALIVCS